MSARHVARWVGLDAQHLQTGRSLPSRGKSARRADLAVFGTLTAYEVFENLPRLGCHSTDISDALYAADPVWSTRYDAEVVRRRAEQEGRPEGLAPGWLDFSSATSSSRLPITSSVADHSAPLARESIPSKQGR